MRNRFRRFAALAALVAAALSGSGCSSHSDRYHGHHNTYYSHHHPYDSGYYRYRHHYPHHVHSYGCGHSSGYHYY